MLGRHLKGVPVPRNDLFSLTSLFRIALQRATDMVSKSKKDIQICVLDTRKVGTATIFPATVLMDKFLLNPNTDLQKVSDTEYVAHGMLDVSKGSSSASLQSLIENGLYDLVPKLEDHLNLTKVGRQGPGFKLSSLYEKDAQSVSVSDINKVLLVASSFGEEWAFMMTIALLTLRKRIKGETELRLLAADFADILQASWQDATWDGKGHSKHEQVANFEMLMQEAVGHSHLPKMSDLAIADEASPNKPAQETLSKPRSAVFAEAYEIRLSSARQVLEDSSSKTTRTLVEPTPRKYKSIKIVFVEDDEDVEQAKICGDPPLKKCTSEYVGFADDREDV